LRIAEILKHPPEQTYHWQTAWHVLVKREPVFNESKKDRNWYYNLPATAKRRLRMLARQWLVRGYPDDWVAEPNQLFVDLSDSDFAKLYSIAGQAPIRIPEDLLSKPVPPFVVPQKAFRFSLKFLIEKGDSKLLKTYNT
jgi:hypothetical protein